MVACDLVLLRAEAAHGLDDLIVERLHLPNRCPRHRRHRRIRDQTPRIVLVQAGARVGQVADHRDVAIGFEVLGADRFAALGQVVRLGGNSAENIAVMVDPTSAVQSMIVLGDWFETNAIVQVNVFSNNDLIARFGDTDAANVDTGGNVFNNMADFVEENPWADAVFPKFAGRNFNIDVVSGDFYDVFAIPTSKQIALIMADVCDKGVGAAMYMAIFRSLFRAYSDQQYIMRWAGVPSANRDETPSGMFRRDALLASGAPSLKNAVDLTNNYIATNHSNSNMFATVFFAVFGYDATVALRRGATPEAALLRQSTARLRAPILAAGILTYDDFDRLSQATADPAFTFVDATGGLLPHRRPRRRRRAP